MTQNGTRKFGIRMAKRRKNIVLMFSSYIPRANKRNRNYSSTFGVYVVFAGPYPAIRTVKTVRSVELVSNVMRVVRSRLVSSSPKLKARIRYPEEASLLRVLRFFFSF